MRVATTTSAAPVASTSQAPSATSTHGESRRTTGVSRALGTSSETNAASTVSGARSFATPLTRRTTAQVRTGSSRALGIPALSPSRSYSVAMTTIWEDLRDPPSRSARWRATLRKQPSAFLLGVQILVILLLPVLEDSDWGRAVISLLSLSAVITAVFTVRSTPALTWLSVTLALPAAVFELWSLLDDRPTILAWPTAAWRSSTCTRRYALISYMFEDYWVTKDELFAVGACFTVLVFAFAYLFLAIQEIWPASFTAYEGEGQRSFLELIYLSAAQLTSVGLSDVGPILPGGACGVHVEQLAGVMYVAMVISRLVALTVMRSRQ